MYACVVLTQLTTPNAKPSSEYIVRKLPSALVGSGAAAAAACSKSYIAPGEPIAEVMELEKKAKEKSCWRDKNKVLLC